MIQSEESPEIAMRELAENFCTKVPHNQDLGFELMPSKDRAGHLRLVPRAALVGDESSGHIFNSVLLSMADACAGLTTYLNLSTPIPIATLDLKMDYFYPAPGDRTLHCVGVCLRQTQDIAFIRCTISAEGSDDLIAVGNAVFILGSGGKTYPAKSFSSMNSNNGK